MIIAVTGSSGSFGRELIPFLESLGHNVLKVSSSIVSDGELNFSFSFKGTEYFEIPMQNLFFIFIELYLHIFESMFFALPL